MSRYIDDDKPFTDDDVAYLKTRSDGEQRIAVNEARFGHLSDEEKQQASDDKDADDQADLDEFGDDEDGEGDDLPEYDDDVIDKVEPLTLNQLRQAAKKENLEASGSKEELQDRLLDFYQDKKNNSTTVPVVTGD